jgi:VWFA-related protein
MRVLLLFVVLLFCAGVTFSQNVDQDDVIRVETDVTNLPFTAMDKKHHFITTLRAEDLRVLEDGVPQTLFTFQKETDKPLAIAFLIDVSFSQEATLPEEKAAVRTFLEKVIHSNRDQVALIPFTGFAYLEQPLTRDLLGVYRVLQQVEIAAPAYLGSGKTVDRNSDWSRFAWTTGRSVNRDLGCSGTYLVERAGECRRSKATSHHPVE